MGQTLERLPGETVEDYAKRLHELIEDGFISKNDARASFGFPPLYQTEDEEPEKESQWKVRWPKDNPFLKERLQPIQLGIEDENDNPVWQLAEKLCVSLVDKENEAIVKAITEYAKKEGFTELILIDKEFIRDAIKKQIPQKPNYEGDGYDDSGNLIYDTWICPNCEDRYEVDYEIHSHCPTCGQAIDWEVKE